MKKNFLKLGMMGLVILAWMFLRQFDLTYAVEEKDSKTVDQCNNPNDNTDPGCSKAYSCEEIFHTNPNEARKCNYDRCVAKNPIDARTDPMSNPCVCKYGAGGGWWTIWIPLNTNFPFIGSCLKKTWAEGADEAALSVLPTVINALSKMLIVIILVVGVIMVIIGGIQWTMGEPKKWQEMIKKVAIGFALLGAMSAILALINPNFFK